MSCIGNSPQAHLCTAGDCFFVADARCAWLSRHIRLFPSRCSVKNPEFFDIRRILSHDLWYHKEGTWRRYPKWRKTVPSGGHRMTYPHIRPTPSRAVGVSLGLIALWIFCGATWLSASAASLPPDANARPADETPAEEITPSPTTTDTRPTEPDTAPSPPSLTDTEPATSSTVQAPLSESTAPPATEPLTSSPTETSTAPTPESAIESAAESVSEPVLPTESTTFPESAVPTESATYSPTEPAPSSFPTTSPAVSPGQSPVGCNRNLWLTLAPTLLLGVIATACCLLCMERFRPPNRHPPADPSLHAPYDETAHRDRPPSSASPVPAPRQSYRVPTEDSPPAASGRIGIVNLGLLSHAYPPGSVVTLADLKAKGLVDQHAERLKILAAGTLDKPLTVIADAFSRRAADRITQTGGHPLRIDRPN